MSKKQINITEVELKNIISESVKNFINENEEYRDNYSIVSDYDRFREELADETSEDYNSDSAFEYEIIDRIYEAQKLFESIKNETATSKPLIKNNGVNKIILIRAKTTIIVIPHQVSKGII